MADFTKIIPKSNGCRPTVLTPKLMESLIENAKFLPCNSILASYCGVNRKTLTSWLQNAKNHLLSLNDDEAPDMDHDHVKLYFGLLKSRSVTQKDGAKFIMDSEDWRAKQWMLTKFNPKVWGDKADEIKELEVKMNLILENYSKVMSSITLNQPTEDETIEIGE